MKSSIKTLAIITLLSIYKQGFTYVPDLFGAYQRGAEAAREANARDAYYYTQMNQPQFYFEIWEKGKKKPKRNLNLSLKKYDVLCWGVYNLPFENGTTVYASELFTMPYNGGLQELLLMKPSRKSLPINKLNQTPLVLTNKS